jgi:DNA-directed RNA polymerase specialized sigma24 family protein
VRRAFQLAWTNWPTVSADPSPEGWVRATAFDLALSPWRGPGRRVRRTFCLLPRRRPKISTPADATADPSVREQDRALLRAMMRLSDPQRRALVLHDVIGLDWAQTAAEVQGSTPVTYGRVARGRRALAESVPGIVGADPELPGFGRRLGDRLRAAALRACPASAETAAAGEATAPPRHSARGRVTRARARLHDGGLTLAAGALTLATAGLLGSGLIWGTPMHPADRPVIPHPTRAGLVGTAGNAPGTDLQPPILPAPPLTPFTTGPGLVQQSQTSSADSRQPSGSTASGSQQSGSQTSGSQAAKNSGPSGAGPSGTAASPAAHGGRHTRPHQASPTPKKPH